jgi:hypothetical protein
MKMRSFDLVWISMTVATGLTIGWLVRSGAAPLNSPPPDELRSYSERRHKEQTPAIRATEKWRTFATQFSTITEEERKAFKKNIALQDRSAAIEALVAQSGPDGFHPDLKKTIDELLDAWAEENFEAAWAWSKQLTGEGTQNFIAGKLLDKLVTTNRELALTHYLELTRTNPSFESKVPEKILAGAALRDADDFLNFAGKLGFSGAPGGDCDFAKDFNFQQVADGVASLLGKEYDNYPVGFPSNFQEIWMLRDRDAAFANFAGGTLKRLSDFDNILETLEEHHKPEVIWDWVVKKIQESEVSSKAIRNGLANVPPASLNGIIQAFPDAASRDRFLTQVAVEGGVTHRADEVPSIAISAMSSPQVRLETLSKMHQERVQSNYPYDISTITESDLQAWGITRQQLTAIFSEPKKESPESK